MNVNELYNTISQNMRFYRMNNLKFGHITLEKLAKLSGININLIRNMEENRKGVVMSLNVINRLASILDIPIYKYFIKRK